MRKRWLVVLLLSLSLDDRVVLGQMLNPTWEAKGSAAPVSLDSRSIPVDPTSAEQAPTATTTVPHPAELTKPKPLAFPGAKPLPPAGPYRPLYFDNDYSFKQDPNHEPIFGEAWKRVPIQVNDTEVWFSTGGELRHRWMEQHNRLVPGPAGDSSYQLFRWRHFADLQVGDVWRGYIEGIHADSFGEELAPHPIDENRWDLLNAFVDAKLFITNNGDHTLRYGRQELIFGRQRLVSALDWGNTRRTFEGFRYLVRAGDWKVDAFAVNPVNSATGFRTLEPFDDQFDVANREVFFSGAYATYSGLTDTQIDLYYLWLEDGNPSPTKADGHRHTLGSRYSKLMPICEHRVWDLDVEAAYQCGTDQAQDVQAGFATAVLGHTWKSATWSPRLSGLFYYGSGDADATDQRNNTFSVMFPLAHAYWGLSDNLAGENLIDWSLQADVKPTQKSSLTAAHHFFQLASENDSLYNVGGSALGTAGNGTSVGSALDLYGYYAFNPNLDLQVGYSWFWYDQLIDRTLPRDDSSQFYVQTSLRY